MLADLTILGVLVVNCKCLYVLYIDAVEDHSLIPNLLQSDDYSDCAQWLVRFDDAARTVASPDHGLDCR